MLKRGQRQGGSTTVWLLAWAVLTAFAGSALVSAQTLPRFTAASIKPSAPGEVYMPRLDWVRDSGYLSVRLVTAPQLIAHAFLINQDNFVGLPAWAHSTRYDIQARMPAGTSDAQYRLMLQSLLADRFQMKAHQAMRPMKVAVLTAGRPGPNLRPASRDCVPVPRHPAGTFGPVKGTPTSEEMAGCSVSMAEVVAYFTAAAITPVVDNTGLKGMYDIDVIVKTPPRAKGESEIESLREWDLAAKAAFKKQLGLNLDFTKLVKRPKAGAGDRPPRPGLGELGRLRSGSGRVTMPQRIETVMMNRLRHDWARAQRGWLAIAAAAVVMGLVIGLGHAPLAYAQTQPPEATALPHFTVVSVKPSPPDERQTPWQRDNGYWAGRKNRIARVIAYGYGIGIEDIVGLPVWAKSDFYDFEARMPRGTSVAQFRLMMQGMLADRFQMKAHIEMRPEPASILTAGQPGPGRVPASSTCVPTPQHPRGAFGTVTMTASIWKMAGCDVSMAEIAHYFTVFTAPNRVADATGLDGRYDVNVTINIPPPPPGATFQMKRQNRLSALKDAFQKQLGLNLDLNRTVKRPMPVLVIDHLAPLSPN